MGSILEALKVRSLTCGGRTAVERLSLARRDPVLLCECRPSRDAYESLLVRRRRVLCSRPRRGTFFSFQRQVYGLVEEEVVDEFSSDCVKRPAHVKTATGLVMGEHIRSKTVWSAGDACLLSMYARTLLEIHAKGQASIEDALL
jgi:hypothetical protein